MEDITLRRSEPRKSPCPPHSARANNKEVKDIPRKRTTAGCSWAAPVEVSQNHFDRNIRQYEVLMNSILGMLPKCRVERSSSRHNNTSSTFIWVNDSLDLYPASRCPSMRTCRILYLILNQYYQKPSLIPWSITSICSITLHRPLWELLYFISYTQSILSKTFSYTLINHIHL
jgi:hypothetical protein